MVDQINTRTSTASFLGVLLMIIGSCVGALADEVPNDDSLLKLFHGHRVAFESLQELVMQDATHESYFSKENLDDKIQDSRRYRYKSLMSEINPKVVVTIDYSGNQRFILAGGGEAAIGPGWLKGIEYIPGDYRKEGILLSDLERAKDLPEDVYLRKIEPNWFLVYQRSSK